MGIDLRRRLLRPQRSYAADGDSSPPCDGLDVHGDSVLPIYGFGWTGGTWEYGDLSFTISDPNAYDATFSFTVPYPSPPPVTPPGAPSLPPVAPIAANTGFAMVVPQLIITYKFNGLSTVCTASHSQITACTPGTPSAPSPSVAGTTPWDPRNNGRLLAETMIQMGCGGTPRCKVALGSPIDTTNGGIKTLKITATVTWMETGWMLRGFVLVLQLLRERRHPHPHVRRRRRLPFLSPALKRYRWR